MLAIYKKEMKAYFHSIIGYLFIGFFLFIIGLYCFMQNIYSGSSNFVYTLYGVRFFFILLIPMITMRLLAEENHQKTDQLLFTSPVPIIKVIAGKYLAVTTMLAIVMAIVCVYPFILSHYGTMNMKQSYSGILVLFLMGCTYLAIGMFISSVTESQAFAAILTFVVILVTSFASIIGQVLPSNTITALRVFAIIVLLIAIITYVIIHNTTFSILFFAFGEAIVISLYFIKPSIYDGLVIKFFDWITVNSRMDDFVYGVFNVSSIVYFVSLTFLFLFLTIQAIKKRRWS